VSSAGKPAPTLVRGAVFHLQSTQRRSRLISTVSTTLSITIEVIGMNTRLRSDSMRMSPDNRPNQLNSQGK